MSDQFIGEIRMFAGNFAPEGWHLCDGELLVISEYEPLYSLIGTTYGGNGTTNFALPDLRGRLPLSTGQGQGLTSRNLGQKGGAEAVVLTPEQMAPHTHDFIVTTAEGSMPAPTPSNILAAPKNSLGGSFVDLRYIPSAEPLSSTSFPLNAEAIGNTGQNIAHANVMPIMPTNFIIALVGSYPGS